MQVAAREVGPEGRVVGVDLAAIEPPLEFANAIALTGDLSQPAVRKAVIEAAGGPADVLLSDAAPKLTGVRATDRAHEEALLAAIEAALSELLAAGGALVLEAHGRSGSAGGRAAPARALRKRALAAPGREPQGHDRALLDRMWLSAVGWATAAGRVCVRNRYWRPLPTLREGEGER